MISLKHYFLYAVTVIVVSFYVQNILYSESGKHRDKMVVDSYTNAALKIHNFLNSTIEDDQLVSQLHRSTQQKVRKSLQVIVETLHTFSLENISISFNGGKDCLVMLYLYLVALHDEQLVLRGAPGKQELVQVNSVYIYYEETFVEIEEFNNEIIANYNLDLHVYSNCQLKVGFEKYLQDHPEVKAIIVGNRRTDPYSGDLRPFQQTDNDWPAFTRVHPILDWTYEEIWYFLVALDIPYCKLYDYGFTSIGGILTTVPNPYLRKSDYENLNKGHINWDNIRYLSKKHEQNKSHKHNLDDQQYYPAFYLQNDDYERFSRTKKQKQP